MAYTHKSALQYREENLDGDSGQVLKLTCVHCWHKPVSVYHWGNNEDEYVCTTWSESCVNEKIFPPAVWASGHFKKGKLGQIVMKIWKDEARAFGFVKVEMPILVQVKQRDIDVKSWCLEEWSLGTISTAGWPSIPGPPCWKAILSLPRVSRVYPSTPLIYLLP